MNNKKDWLILLALLMTSVVLGWYFSEYIGMLYINFFIPGQSCDFCTLIGLPCVYLFFMFLTIPLFIKTPNKIIYFGVFALALVFEIALGFLISQFLFSFVFAIIGYILARIIRKVFRLQTPKV